MHRLITYSILIIAISIPAVLLARTLIVTEEDRLETLIFSIEDDNFESLLNSASPNGLVVSVGSEIYEFGVNEHEQARILIKEFTGIDQSNDLNLRQHRLSVSENQATAILNIAIDDDDYTALRVNLSLQEGSWTVERIRVMG